MKISKLIAPIVASFLFLQVNAQNDNQTGFSKGTVVLQDSSVISGYFKDNIRKDASILLLNETGGKVKKYSGDEIISVELEARTFICFKGDFFKIVCKGELCFLQKSSNASEKPVYNGTEAFFVNGTAGKPGDYFIYDSRKNELNLVSNKTFAAVTTSSFAGCALAIEKAKTAQGNIALLGEAVEIYNNTVAEK